MPSATLIDYTGKTGPDPQWYAARLLAFTKNTRLNMNPDGFRKFEKMPQDELKKELEYMSSSIASSWEFIDVTFLIQNVSRATAQQITRTRTGSYAMASQRVMDMSDVTWDAPEVFDDALANGHKKAMKAAIASYSDLVKMGLPLEDAREVLPIGVHCNLVAKYNFRSFVDLVKARESLRVQGAYRSVAAQMKAQVIQAWPWSVTFFEHPQDKALAMLAEVANELKEAGAMYKGPAGKIAKAVDLIRKA